MKEFYFEKYMNGLRDKILEYDNKQSPANSRRSSVKSAPTAQQPVSVTPYLLRRESCCKLQNSKYIQGWWLESGLDFTFINNILDVLQYLNLRGDVYCKL